MTESLDHTLDRLRRAHALAKSPKDKAEVESHLRAAEWRKVQRDPWYFFSNLARTKNEHTTDPDEDPYKPFPNHAYVKEMVDLFHTKDRILVPKSRQVMVSWLATTFCLWWCLSKKAQLAIIQSKKEEDAGKQLERAYGTWERLPTYVRQANPCVRQKKPPQLYFPATDSTIMGIPEGGDQVRSNTASLFFGDEAAFQPQFSDAFVALQAALEGGGHAIIGSSAKAGRMYELVAEPRKPGTHQVLVPSWSEMNGLEVWETESDWTVARLHYSADPRKDLEWAKEAAKKYGRLGMQDKGWQAEMEIDPGANLGKRVYDEFQESSHVIRGFKDREGNNTHIPPEGWPVFLGIDPGYRDPCAVMFMALDGDGCWYVWDELYVREKTPKQVARMIKAKLAKVQEPDVIYIGHDAASKTMSGGGVSIQDQFADERIFTEIAYGKIEARIMRMNEVLRLQANGEPRFKVLERCVNTIYEFKNYRYPDRTLEQLLKRDEGEKPQDKDNHAMDSAGNVVLQVPDSYARKWSGASESETKWETVPQAARAKVFRNRKTKADYEPGYWD